MRTQFQAAGAERARSPFEQFGTSGSRSWIRHALHEREAGARYEREAAAKSGPDRPWTVKWVRASVRHDLRWERSFARSRAAMAAPGVQARGW
jgi:hypothetical protein